MEMSEMSSEAESSCGWIIITNEGSDIETLGSEAVVEYGAELLERSPVEETELQDTQASESAAECVEESIADSLDDTLGEHVIDETLHAAETGDNTAEKRHVSLLSSSDHSDIVSLGDLREDEQVEVEQEAEPNKELYLGTPCSSQYTFAAAETVLPVLQPALTNSSSSEDEDRPSSSTAVRKRRLRRNTTSIVTEPDDEEETLESGQSDEWKEKEDEGQQEERAEVRHAAGLRLHSMQGEGSSILNKCILIAIVLAISMGFGHLNGTIQIPERQKTMEKMRLNELEGVRDLLYQHVGELFTNQGGDFDLDDHKVVSLLTEVIEKVKKEKQELNIQRTHIKAQRDDLEMLLRQKAEERTHIVSQQQRLTAENQLLKSSLEREEKSLSTLQEELRNLRSEVRDREAMGARADSLLSENHRLKDQLEEEKLLIQNFHSQRDNMMAEAQTLRKKLDKEKKVTDELRREIFVLRTHIPEAAKELKEAEELQSRLMELEKRLSFEQQRSDLWERLYVETKEERAKGDTESKVRNAKPATAGKMKDTFDAVKNSTKEFVHRHKERIKKAKEAVKENLRKFSDSVKSTFQNFKDSASTFIHKARGLYEKRGDEKKKNKESWQHRSHKPNDKHSHGFDDSFQSNTRKSGGKVHKDGGHNAHKSNLKRCTDVFDCAFEESMRLFNRPMEPIRTDEFYQLLRSYLQQEVDHFHHWKDLEMYVNSFFHNGVFVHDKMLFTDFVSGMKDYLTDMREYHGLDGDVFEDIDDYVYRHFFGESYAKVLARRQFKTPNTDFKDSKTKRQKRKQQRGRSQPHSKRKWSRSGRNTDRHMADMKIEVGPIPFGPKY